MTIPKHVRARANEIARTEYPSDDVAWTNKATIRRLRRDLADAYLVGWEEAHDGLPKQRTVVGVTPHGLYSITAQLVCGHTTHLQWTPKLGTLLTCEKCNS